MTDSLRGVFDDIEAPDRSLVVLNRKSPDPVRGLLDSLLEGGSVEIHDLDTSEPEADVVALVEDGEVLARSTLDELLESVLLINSDLYKTGPSISTRWCFRTCSTGSTRCRSGCGGIRPRTRRSSC